MKELFRICSQKASDIVGSYWAFLFALLLVIIWAITGPFFDYSATWQLVINTGTTIITFLMIFLVQNTQNRDSKSIELKLDELIHTQKHAHNNLMGIENKSDRQLQLAKDKIEKVETIRKKRMKRNATLPH